MKQTVKILQRDDDTITTVAHSDPTLNSNLHTSTAEASLR